MRPASAPRGTTAVALRIVPQVRLAPDKPHQYGALLGHALTVRLEQAIDVFDLWRDLKRFTRSWRPMRRRAEGAKQSVQQRAAWMTGSGWVTRSGEHDDWGQMRSRRLTALR
jgi:hypothetical protein